MIEPEMALGPKIIYNGPGGPFYISNLAPLASAAEKNLLNRSAHYFVEIGWTTTFSKNASLTRKVQCLRDHGVRFSLFMNCPNSFRRFRKRFPDLRCGYVSELYFFYLRNNYGSNFSVTKSVNRKYQAVLVSRRNGYKNRHLANKVSQLACVIPSGFDEPEQELPNAAYINQHFLRRPQLNQLFSQSGCGLILSYGEGASRTTIEYLLAGLPVISIQSIGGREMFLDDENSIIIPQGERNDTTLQKQVQQAVFELAQKRNQGQIDPSRIRSRTLARLRWFHERFLDAILDVCHLREAPLNRNQIEQTLLESAPSMQQIYSSHQTTPGKIVPPEKAYFSGTGTQPV